MNVIDTHMLYGVDHWLSQNKKELAHSNDYKNIKKELFNASINYSAHITPFPSSEDGSYIKENQIILDAVRMDPSFTPVFAFNPNNIDSCKSISEFTEKVDRYGIMIWPILCNIHFKDLQKNKDFIDLFSNKNSWCVLHVAAGHETQIGRSSKLTGCMAMDAVELAGALPGVKFNLGHLLRLSDSSLRKIAAMDNVVVETSGLSSHNRWFESLMNVFPSIDSCELKNMAIDEILKILCDEYALAEKIVFGSSFPYSQWWSSNIQKEVLLIADSQLDVKQKANILENNAKKLFIS